MGGNSLPRHLVEPIGLAPRHLAPPGAIAVGGTGLGFRFARLWTRGEHGDAVSVFDAADPPGEAAASLAAIASPRTPLVPGLAADRPLVMGTINVTPDSFSDGGRFFEAGAAIAAGEAMRAAGADLLDIGGESTRPGSAPVPPEEEQARILPVIAALAPGGPVSVDTRNAATMRAALAAGASIINDVSALAHDPGAAGVVAEAGCPVILMHMRGTPATMRALTRYRDVALDVAEELAARVAAAEAAGIARARIVLDPGIGFAKTPAQNLELLARLPVLHGLGCPVLVGVWRKSFIGLYGNEPDAARRLPGSLAAALAAVGCGASIIRVHDVGETVQALAIWRAIACAGAAESPGMDRSPAEAVG
ncbi:dihydropteroate synthase [Elioraea rosea]|uniref:dihydropteroate synthase n=1 Tax=Elioraea rosea TaxID=2492390 RepID=UPI001EF46E14|nr:dihydropteroate synthase [Elioraea rosea]